MPTPKPVRRRWPAALGVAALATASLLAWTAWGGQGASWPAPAEGGAWLLERQRDVQGLQARSPWLFAGVFFAAFAVLSAFTLPGCSVLCLAAGLCFGAWVGTAIVTAAATAGAALSFSAARHLLRERIAARYARQHAALQAAITRHGDRALLSLRLVPVVPFAIVNPLMGLSHMSLARFSLVSFVGMLPGSALYVLAGLDLPALAAGRFEVSAATWAALAGLAVLPWLVRRRRERAR